MAQAESAKFTEPATPPSVAMSPASNGPFGCQLKALPAAIFKGWMAGGIYTFRTGGHLFVDQDGDGLNIDPSGPVTQTSYNEIRPDLVFGQSPALPAASEA